MTNRSMHNALSVDDSIVPAVQSATATGTGVDLQGYDSAEVVVNFGAIVSAGDFAASVEESDTLGSGYTAVAAADLRGSFLATALASTVEQVGYVGSKRYIRVILTKAGGTSIAAGAVVVRGGSSMESVA